MLQTKEYLQPELNYIGINPSIRKSLFPIKMKRLKRERKTKLSHFYIFPEQNRSTFIQKDDWKHIQKALLIFQNENLKERIT